MDERDFAANMLRMCGGYIERARVSAGDERERAIVMAVSCLAWAVWREPAKSLPLFREAA